MARRNLDGPSMGLCYRQCAGVGAMNGIKTAKQLEEEKKKQQEERKKRNDDTKRLYRLGK